MPLVAITEKSQHQRCVRLLAEWPGRLLVPEPVLGETCNFLRNNVPSGAAAEIRFLRAMLDERGDFDIVDPVPEDRRRAVALANRLVAHPSVSSTRWSSPLPSVCGCRTWR